MKKKLEFFSQKRLPQRQKVADRSRKKKHERNVWSYSTRAPGGINLRKPNTTCSMNLAKHNNTHGLRRNRVKSGARIWSVCMVSVCVCIKCL